jgi:hypothetical protein
MSYDLYVVYSYLNYYKLGVEKDRDSTSLFLRPSCMTFYSAFI